MTLLNRHTYASKKAVNDTKHHEASDGFQSKDRKYQYRAGSSSNYEQVDDTNWLSQESSNEARRKIRTIHDNKLR